MSFRKTTLALVVAAAAAPAAFASSGATWIGGEAGFAEHALTSQRTRAEVQQEYLAFRDHPVYADGTVFIQGELGYVPANQGVFADRQPSEPHTHALGNSGSPNVMQAAPLSDAERRDIRQQYIN